MNKNRYSRRNMLPQSPVLTTWTNRLFLQTVTIKHFLKEVNIDPTICETIAHWVVSLFLSDTETRNNPVCKSQTLPLKSDVTLYLCLHGTICKSYLSNVSQKIVSHLASYVDIMYTDPSVQRGMSKQFDDDSLSLSEALMTCVFTC